MCRLRHLIALTLLLIVPTAAEGQTSTKIGPHLGVPVGEVSEVGGNLFFGGEARVKTVALPVVINPSLDYYLMGDRPLGRRQVGQSLLRVDVNALYEFGGKEEVFTPYAGGGLGITRYSYDADPRIAPSEDTEVGLNIVGGGRLQLGRVEPFAQLNAAVLDDWDRLGLTTGILLRL